MSETSSFERLTRREAFSLLGWAAARGLAASGIVLFATAASAETFGMERRQERLSSRHEWRIGRAERRDERRNEDTNMIPRVIVGRQLSA